jgi:hypothetical protein
MNKSPSRTAALANLQAFLAGTRARSRSERSHRPGVQRSLRRPRRLASRSCAAMMKPSRNYCSGWTPLWGKAMSENSVVDEVLPETVLPFGQCATPHARFSLIALKLSSSAK